MKGIISNRIGCVKIKTAITMLRTTFAGLTSCFGMSLAKDAQIIFKMTAFNIVLEVSALLAIIIIPLAGPKKRKTAPVKTLSNLSVKENGYLEYTAGNSLSHHPVD